MWEVIISIVVMVFVIVLLTITLGKVEKKPKNLVLASIFAALTAVGAYIKIPIPVVPFTMQVFFVLFSGIILGSKLGLISQLVYILVGLAGAPVFTGGGGITYVFTPTFGYIVGFALASFIVGLIVEKLKKNHVLIYLLASLIGTAVIYVCGVPYLYFMKSFYMSAEFTFKNAIYYGFLVTILGDIASNIIMCSVAPFIVKVLKPLRA